MNLVVLSGYLTQDVEIKTTQNGKAVANFQMGVSDPYDEETTFARCVVWGESAKNLGKYLKKGSFLEVTGKMKNKSYEKDGQKRYYTEIQCNHIEYGPKKGRAE
ncbi:single-stranded DNA-binding protein [Faecalitalea cylindroides]|uniref:Single-stranded DNA-binding protein n=1 Tax=Faecalitalea cylindroides TaxID=39483 RepID=A0AAW6FTM1_9FIRM|nr:single-stranded DNA-binding protein [Faecalitalea cylindroides]MDC0828336.1 single-stranded DNA-binding protein [Faecalitalea cylindroides]